MGLLDRLRNRQPSKTQRGASGRSHTNGFLDYEELNNELRGQQGLRVFDKMYRSDPDVRRVVWMLANPIIGGTWTVEPYGGDEAEEKDRKVAEAVEWALFKVMRPRWKAHLIQALPVGMRSGFAPFEQVWTDEEYEGKQLLVPKTLGLRLPRTIHEFHQKGEDLEYLVQYLPIGGTVKLPAEDLVYYRWGAEGDNWEGTSLLRAAYKPWFLKDKLERIDAIKGERQATGVPICYPPRNATPKQLESMEEAMAGLRTAEQAYLMMPGPKAVTVQGQAGDPNGWLLEILGHKDGENSQILPSLEYHSTKIATAFIAEFMRLGQGEVGARATADVQQNPFLAAVEGAASVVEDEFNSSLVQRFVALNFDVDEPPRLTMSLVDSTSLTELADYIQKLQSAQALYPDDELEDFLRDRADLPPADAEDREERKAQAAELAKAAAAATEVPPENGGPTPAAKPPASKPPAPKPTPPPKADLEQPTVRADREMRWWEGLMQLQEIETSINEARARFEKAAGDESRALAKSLTAAALKGGSPGVKPTAALIDAIEAELGRLYDVGALTVERELNAQRSTPLAAPRDRQRNKDLRRRAQLAAQSIASRLWQRISNTVLNNPGNEAAAQAAGETEAAAALRAEAQLHAAAAVNLGRQDTADEHAEEIRGARYTSILDANRCENCGTADDDVLRPLDDPVRLQRIPPNGDCYGGGRCRCMEFYELTEEAAGYGGSPAPDPAVQVATSTAVADHFVLSGGSQAARARVEEMLAAIQQVHKMPASMPTIPLVIREMQEFGMWQGAYSLITHTWTDERISLSRAALGHDPPINSTVHEIGHFLDNHGFGEGPPEQAILLGEAYSSTDAMVEWRRAAMSSHAYQALVTAGGSNYVTSTEEVLARSYEQYIALRSGNEQLARKIAHRRLENRNLYWDDDDFVAIADAFDNLLVTRGLRSAS